MKHTAAGFIVLSSLAASLLSAAPEPLPYLPALQCLACHRPANEAGGGIPPIDAGNAERLQRMLLDFKQGHVPATIMDRISRGYTDDELKKIAVFFASQPGENHR